MTPKERANELVDKYKNYVTGYIGSSMLINHEYPEQILKNAIQCALIAVEEIDGAITKTLDHTIITHNQIKELDYWQEVKNELKQLKP